MTYLEKWRATLFGDTDDGSQSIEQAAARILDVATVLRKCRRTLLVLVHSTISARKDMLHVSEKPRHNALPTVKDASITAL